MKTAAETLEGGFAEPVFGAQAVFRAVMDAMARPGTVVALGETVTPPAPLVPAAAAVACTLCDADTPIWLDEALAASEAVRTWLAFQTGAPFAVEAEQGAFAFVAAPHAMPPLDWFAQGTQDYPDRSATLVLQLDALDSGDALRFEGPGIRDRATLAPKGLPKDFAEQWRANAKRFPRGVDLILTSGDGLLCLPRSARLVEGG